MYKRQGPDGLLFPGVGQCVQLPGHVGDRDLGVGGEQTAHQRECGGLSPALLGQPLSGARVDGDADLPDRAGQQPYGRALLQPAERAGPDVGDAGQRPGGGGDDQAVRVLREQRVDLFGVGGVVEHQDDPPHGERFADQLGQLVPVGAGRDRHAEEAEEFTGGAFGGDRLAAGIGEADPEHPVRVGAGARAADGPGQRARGGRRGADGVGPGERSGQLLGERAAAGTGAAGDEQDARAGGLAAGQGVQAGALDVLPQRLQLPFAAEESGWGCAGRLLGPRGRRRAAGVHRLIGHEPRSTSLHAVPAGAPAGRLSSVVQRRGRSPRCGTADGEHPPIGSESLHSL